MFLNDENEDVVETTENVEEQTTEEIVEGEKVATEDEQKSDEKTYTEADIEKLVNERIDKLMPSKIERAKSRIERDYAEKLNKYERVESILNAGLGTDNLDDTISKLSDFYSEQGVEIPKESKYSQRDLDILARAEANEIINSGFDEIVAEVDRLAKKGINNMTEREKITFQRLAEERKRQESMQELNKIGVGAKELNDKEYKEFAEKLNPSMSEKEKYEMYLKFKPKKKIETIGSMKNAENTKPTVKDFYTKAEAEKFTREDFNKNPKLYEAVIKSMQSGKW